MSDAASNANRIDFTGAVSFGRSGMPVEGLLSCVEVLRVGNQVSISDGKMTKLCLPPAQHLH